MKPVETVTLPAAAPGAFERAVQALDAGGLVAFPTDTVYGLGARADHPEAIDNLYQVKGRDTNKAIAILIGRVADLAGVAGSMPVAAHLLAARYWPGPLTLVVPRHPGLPANLSPLPTIGVRMPDHPVALELLTLAGPLAVTSANLSGSVNTSTAAEVHDQLHGKVDLILDGGRTPGGVPSTVVDCTSPELTLLRPGPITQEQINACLGG